MKSIILQNSQLLAFSLSQSILRSQLACFWLKFQSGSIKIIFTPTVITDVHNVQGKKMSKFTKCPPMVSTKTDKMPHISTGGHRYVLKLRHSGPLFFARLGRQGLDWIIGPGYSFGASRFAPPAISSVDDPDWLGAGREQAKTSLKGQE